MGALMPLSFIVLGDFVSISGPSMLGVDQILAYTNSTALTTAERAKFESLIGTCPDGMTKKVNMDINQLMPSIYLFLYFGFGMLAAGYIGQLCFMISGENQAKRIRQLYVHSVLRQDCGWFDKAEDGSLTSRLAQDTYLIQEGISEKIGRTLQSIAGLFGGFIIAFMKSWKMSFVMLSSAPFFSIGFLIMISGLQNASSGSQ
ncbi:hypothetical protein HK096_000305, partial [Nowakowskiella sp. JEL0078]